MRFILILILFCFSNIVFAQQSDSKLAYTYYQNKEYVKAAEMFLQLYERTRASYYLDYHIISLINAKEYDSAEKTLKKYLKTDDNNKDFLVNLGYIYTQQGKTNKAEEYFNRAVKKLIPYENDIHSLANKFRNIREYNWANKTYLKGRELLNRPLAFTAEMGDNYMMDRDYDNMFALFVEALLQNPEKLSTITSKLSFARSYDVNGNADKVIASQLEKIFRQKDYPSVFDELGVWYSLQTGDYTQAFNHAVKLNAKNTDKLYIYIDIAHEAANARKYDIARQAYQRVIQKGKEENPYYYTARKEILNCKYRQYDQAQPPVENYRNLVSECKDFLQETGYSNANADIIVLTSDLYAYHLSLPDSADQILQKGIGIKRLNTLTLDILKSKRADLLTYMNNPWEAVILYTQIEKANPNNDIGYEAKLKKARLAYFEGDLLWAKAQYDVLKGSTSKLISNDALQMSHFLNMNYEEEGDNSDLERLATTEYAVYRHQSEEVLPVLDSLIQNSATGIADYAALVKSGVLLSQHQDQEAALILEKLAKASGQTYIRAKAIFELANLKNRTDQKQQALGLYQQLVSDYSGSVYSVEAGKIYRELEKTIKNEKITPVN